MENEEAGLAALRASMSEQQRRDMAEIIRNEMVRRGMPLEGDERRAGKSVEKTIEVGSSQGGIEMKRQTKSGLSRDQVGELYTDMNDAVKKLRMEKIEQRLAEVKNQGAREQPRARTIPRMTMPKLNFSGGKILLMVGILALGGAKIASTFTAGSDSVEVTPPADARGSLALPMQVGKSSERIDAPVMMPAIAGATSERQLLMELDARRVELERRREGLDKREADLRNQAQALTERFTELQGLTAKLAEGRKDQDRQYESRLAQLANVYGAMDPNESAQLIARLEDPTALELLQRMPEKRMGQILGFMDKERAVELTRILTERSPR